MFFNDNLPQSLYYFFSDSGFHFQFFITMKPGHTVCKQQWLPQICPDFPVGSISLSLFLSTPIEQGWVSYLLTDACMAEVQRIKC